jgi:hypothetical protein
MEQIVLVTVSGPDPKLVKTELTSNSSTKDGQTRFSSTGKTHYFISDINRSTHRHCQRRISLSMSKSSFLPQV